MVKNNEISS